LDEVRSPAKAVKEAVQILRRLFDGEKVDHEGEFFRVRSVRFQHPGRKIPIYVSGRHQHMLRVIGEVADGSLLDGPPGYIVNMLPHINNGLKRTGRELSDVDIGHVTYVSVDEDVDDALEAGRSIAPYQIAFQSPMMLQDAGVSESLRNEVRSFFEKKGLPGLPEAASLVPDKVVEQLAVVGDVNSCVRRLVQLGRMGITHFVVHWPYGPDEATGLRLIAGEVRPAVLRELG
jgi:5,10-methylenetetrahydromethanopterin reductase